MILYPNGYNITSSLLPIVLLLFLTNWRCLFLFSASLGVHFFCPHKRNEPKKKIRLSFQRLKIEPFAEGIRNSLRSNSGCLLTTKGSICLTPLPLRPGLPSDSDGVFHLLASSNWSFSFFISSGEAATEKRISPFLSKITQRGIAKAPRLSPNV